MGIYIGQQRLAYLWGKIKNLLATGLSGKADKATTLSGYGITDAKITNGTITLGGSTITPLTSYTETDPTVPAWAKAASKPSYTAAEVGALPDTTVIPAAQVNSDWNASSGVAQILNKPTIPTVPTALSAFTDDLGSSPTHTHSQYLTSAPVTSVNGQTGAVSLTIPSAVTESTVTGWGFTKNGGTVTSTGGTIAVNNIQVVAALPASPDANTLYLIPES